MFKFSLGVTYKKEFYGVRFGKKEIDKPVEEQKVKVLIQNHPVYQKYADLFREKVLELTSSPDYSLVTPRMVGNCEIFSYAGVDFLKVEQVEYLDTTDIEDKKKHYLTMKITIHEIASVNMADGLPN